MTYFYSNNKDFDNIDNILLELGILISLEDTEVLKKIKLATSNPKEFYENNKKDLEPYWINEETKGDVIKEVSTIEILKNAKYLYSFSWSTSLSGIKSELEKSKIVKKYDLNLDSDFLEKGLTPTDWFEVLDESWREKGFTLAGFNINNDSYEVFITKEDNFEKIIELTDKLGAEAKRAKDL